MSVSLAASGDAAAARLIHKVAIAREPIRVTPSVLAVLLTPTREALAGATNPKAPMSAIVQNMKCWNCILGESSHFQTQKPTRRATLSLSRYAIPAKRQ